MPELTVLIGGVAFDVACKEGEEAFLKTAAGMLDTEATALKSALGRIPENRMLLMAGLMLADKTASLEDELKASKGTPDEALQKRLTQAEAVLQDTLGELATLKARDKNTSAVAVGADDTQELRAQLHAAQEALEAASANTGTQNSADDIQVQLNEASLALESEKAAHAATKTVRDEAFEAARTITAKLTETAEALKEAG